MNNEFVGCSKFISFFFNFVKTEKGTKRCEFWMYFCNKILYRTQKFLSD